MQVGNDSGVFIGHGTSQNNRAEGNYIGVDVNGGKHVDPTFVGIGKLGDGVTIDAMPGDIVGGAQEIL